MISLQDDDEDTIENDTREVILTIRAEIEPLEDGRIMFSAEHEAHPGISFIGGRGGEYVEGDEIRVQEQYKRELSHYTKRPIRVKFTLNDLRKKQTGIESFF